MSREELEDRWCLCHSEHGLRIVVVYGFVLDGVGFSCPLCRWILCKV